MSVVLASVVVAFFVFAAVVYEVWAWSVVYMWAWGWIVLPMFPAAGQPTTAQMVGIVLLVSALKFRSASGNSDELAGQFVSSLISPWLVALVLWGGSRIVTLEPWP